MLKRVSRAPRLPALRKRKEDIRPFVVHFVRLSCARLNRAPVELSDGESLMSYDWPGNVRELHNVIERAIILGNRARLRLDAGLTDARTFDAPQTPVVHRWTAVRRTGVKSCGRTDSIGWSAATPWPRSNLPAGK